MGQKITIGLLAGIFIGIFIASFFLPEKAPIQELFLTKITAASIITAFLTSIYGHLSKSKMQVFIISTLIGVVVFYIKYLISGEEYDSLIITLGALVGALLGVIHALNRIITYSLRSYRRRLRKEGFRNYY